MLAYGPETPEFTLLIGKLRRRPWAARALAWRWQRQGYHAAVVALLQAAGLGQSGLVLDSLFALEMHAAFLARCGSPRNPRRHAQIGLSHFAIGQVESAVPHLEESLRRPADWGLWLRAATMLAIADPQRLVSLLRERRREPVAMLLLAHLAERSGEDAGFFLAHSDKGAGRPAEYHLLCANLAKDEQARAGHVRAALAHFGLTDFGLADFSAAPPSANKGPLVSVIIAACNAQDTVGNCLKALLSQSWASLEILLVDDASSDQTRARAEIIASTDSRLRIIALPANQGAYVARNIGAEAAKGEIICFQDADDIAHPERIARQLGPLLANARLAATTARWVRRDASGRFRDRQILPLVRFHTLSVMIRRAWFERLGGFEPVRYGADNDLLLRLGAAAAVLPLNLPLTFAGADAGSAVHHPDTGYGARGYALARQAWREQSAGRLIGNLASAST